MERIADLGNGPSGYFEGVCVLCVRPIVCVPDSVLCRHSNYQAFSSIIRITSMSVPGESHIPGAPIPWNRNALSFLFLFRLFIFL